LNVLVTGSAGLLGRAFATHTPTGWTLLPRTRADLDITDPDAVAAALDDNPIDLVVNCAAYTEVDQAESDSEAAYRANVIGPSLVAKCCCERNILLVHISTDFVFDGRALHPYNEGDAIGPLSVYGQTKSDGEQAVAAAQPDHLIVRTAWLYGDEGACFPRTVLRLARERGALSVVDDQVGSPTYAPHLVDGIAVAIGAGARGVLHLAGSGQVTRLDFAAALLTATGVSADLSPAKTADFPAAAQRPAFSALSSNHDCGVRLSSWQSGVAAFADQESSPRK
jgi:dTDP-4-dehydrorhamnose reductase